MVRSATAWIEHSSILCHINLHSHLLHGLQDINITIGLECITLLYTAPVPSSFSVMKSENGSWVFLLDGEFLTGSGFCLILVLLCLQKKTPFWWSIICFSSQNCSLNFCPCLKNTAESTSIFMRHVFTLKIGSGPKLGPDPRGQPRSVTKWSWFPGKCFFFLSLFYSCGMFLFIYSNPRDPEYLKL